MRASRFLLFCIAGAVVACGEQSFQGGPDAPSGPPCADGVDNDGDGLIDFPDDQGCRDADDESEQPACGDGIDNDGDGKIDFPNDPGCPIPHSDDEMDGCPGPTCPQCGDDIDNDGNGKTDFPDDPGCTSASDPLEFTDDPNACGIGMVIKTMPLNGMDSGMLAGTTSTVESPCGGGNGLPGTAYLFHLPAPAVIIATTNDPGTTIDTILDLRTSMCNIASSEIACHDDIVPGSGSTANKKSELTASLPAGSYYLIVGGKTAADVGAYVLRVQFFAGEGSACGATQDCGPGLVCRVPAGESQMICTGPVCDDGRDDDQDGKVDYPADPGCESPDDTDETDDCPSGPNCPRCANGIDDDNDGDIDFPDDINCTSAGHNFESCQQTEPVIVATTPVVSGTTAGQVDDYRPVAGSFNGHACSTTGTHSAPDVAIELELPALTMLDLNLTAPSGSLFDSSHTLLDASCGGTPIDCRDSPTMPLTNIAAGTYYVIVDGWSSGSGPFNLNISGTIANGESCEMPLAVSGALRCGPNHTCKGTPGSRTCQPAECNDMVDNNGDGRIDYPEDPGCTDPDDDTETTVCPGPDCPACSDGIDNDEDGLIDYPTDTSCVAAGGTKESCAQTEDIIIATGPTVTGTTVGQTNDYRPVAGSFNGHLCSTSSTHTAPDVAIQLDLPALLTLDLDLSAPSGTLYDSSHTLLDGTCSGTPIDCRDAPAMPLTNIAAGRYYLIVDGYSSGSGAFKLDIDGTIQNGEPCDNLPLSASGALRCGPGYACKGTPGAKTCQIAECGDMVDNNGDGLIDFPDDPGCTDPNDDTETTVCPGPSCPVCSDGVDNDNDGLIDYPNDPGCFAASSTTEGCTQSELITVVTMPQTSGTTVGATNDFTPPPGQFNGHACGTTGNHTAPDVAFQLDLPATTSLDLNITFPGSTFDTTHVLLDSTCGGTPIDCRDAPAMPLTNLAAGTYYLIVDGFSTASGAFTLNVSGKIANGESCESALAQSGALTCGAGYACKGTQGSRTCQRTECGDGADNNGDGKIDFPDDPGCESRDDDSEETVCPGPMCPACSNGIDDDMDGLIDYPDDPGCWSASDMIEACMQTEPIVAITSAVTTGTTVGAVNDYVPYCGSSTHTAPDVVLELDIPDLETLTLDVQGFDTAHSLLDSMCSPDPIACSDPAAMTTKNLSAGRYYVVIEGWGTTSGAWTLTTSGTVAPGGSCEGALFQAGVFTCASGLTCAGPIGSRTCQAQCSDGIDNNGDGTIDYPADPGCDSAKDDTEDLVCPGPMCPACSNTIDDDMDGAIDWPLDFGCSAASSNGEAFCPAEPDFAGVITKPTTFGTLVGKTPNYHQSCLSSTANDVVHALVLPVPVTSLTIDTLGSVANDTVLSIKDAQCTIEYACDDDGAFGSDNRSLINLPGLPAGSYAIQVDAASTSSNSAYQLNVRGIVAPNTDCTSPLFMSGVLRCPAGTTCTGGICQ